MKKTDENRGIAVRLDHNSWGIFVFDALVFVVWFLYRLKKYGFYNPNTIVFLCIIATFSIFAVISKRTGIIFKDEKVYCYYGLSEKVYDISSIVCVKCSVTYTSSTHIMNPYIKYADGTYAKTLFYLKETKDGMELKENSYNFERKFNRSILFSSVYDERVLQYLKIVNPNIVIMECED